MRTALALAALAASAAALAGEPELATEEERTLYALGVAAAAGFEVFRLSPTQFEVVKRGLGDALGGRPLLVDAAAYADKVKALASAREVETARARASIESAVADSYARREGAVRTPSGVVYISVREGSGPSPGPDDLVRIVYEGRLADDSVFDASSNRLGPVVVPLERSIRCWREGIGRMKVGGRARLVCPASTAYGDRGLPGVVPGGATLIFDVELVSIPGNLQTESPAAAARPGEAAPPPASR